MDGDEIKRVLRPEIFQPDGSLASLGWYLDWPVGDREATLDGAFTADELEAIASWMRLNTKP